MRRKMFSRWLLVVFGVWGAALARGQSQVIHVDAAAVGANDGTSWSDAFNRLQDALATASAAPKPLEVHVAQGLYRPDHSAGITSGGAATVFRLLNGVTLKGGYGGVQAEDPDARDVERYPSLLTGRLFGDANTASDALGSGPCVVTAQDVDASAVLDGFTVTNAGGDGMQVQAASPVVTACTFADCVGFGLWSAPGSAPSLSSCRFINSLDAGLFAFRCDVALTNCLFEGNGSVGSHRSALYCDNSHLVATDCTFRGNAAGAVGGSGTVDLSGCTFVDNVVLGGRDVVDGLGDVRMRGCLFRSNAVTQASILNARGDVEIIDCEFVANSAPGGATVSVLGDSLTVARCSFVDNWSEMAGALVISTTVTRLSDCTFIGNGCSPEVNGQAGAVFAGGEIARISNCLFTGNTGRPDGTGAILGNGRDLRVSNCTFAGNRGRTSAVAFSPSRRDVLLGLAPLAELTQCIVWDGSEPFGPMGSPALGSTMVVIYSDVQGGYVGEGNFEADPCFVSPGYWDDAGTPDDTADDVWVSGDYHLKSQAGHWDRQTEAWGFDDVTSPCIDAGDPNGFLGDERFPNGGYVNLGAHGGTLEASRSYFGGPVCENQLAGDINGDCKVDQTDLDILLSHWLTDSTEVPNRPPTITVISPEDGAEIFRPAALILRADATDPDGMVLEVRYFVEYRWDSSTWRMELPGSAFAQNWEAKFSTWSNVPFDGTYTVWAEATDNEGATTTSDPITITLHPQN